MKNELKNTGEEKQALGKNSEITIVRHSAKTPSSGMVHSRNPKPSGNQLLPTMNDRSSPINKTAPGASSQGDLYRVSEWEAPETCPDCVDGILDFLYDPSNDEASKVLMAQNWIKPGTKEEALALVELFNAAHELEQADLKDRLLLVLAGTDSSGATEVLISIVNGEVPTLPFRELPEDLQYAIQKAIRLNPHREKTGKLLAESIEYQATNAALEDLQKINHPMMLFYQAQDADQRGDTQKVNQILESFQDLEDSKTIEGIMLLGKENIVSIEGAGDAAYEWANTHGEVFDQDCYESYLSEPDADPAERSVAAIALTASNEPERALQALRKAYDNEADPDVRYYYEEAISMIMEQK
ncbi:HEAT repeat domain-containing protein [Desulfococcus sp.]|uniref:HEAT repeat domain-containing protein n=1 Tax=Desulfococcus sp. TaxID=2025834 RepID=UPI003593DA14